MRYAVRVAASLALLMAVLVDMLPAPLNAENRPLDTPTGTVRLYFHALDSGQCDLAFKFAGTGTRSLSSFRRSCRAIRRVVVEQLTDPAYRLHPQNATYTCLALRYTVYGDVGTASFGGWYLLERTIGPTWHILPALSHVAKGGSAIRLTGAQCASHLPSYVRPGSGTVISGYAFLPPTSGWIALSTSGSYVPNGSCSLGIGSNCDAASTIVYRTEDSGSHWTPLLHFTAAVGKPVWVRLFSRKVGLVVATVGPLTAASNSRFSAALFSTRDSGRSWQRFPLPVNYATQAGTISFPDVQHGWLWYGDAAMGSMAVYLYRTTDGGRHWSRAACASFSYPMPGFGCPHPSGIGLGGDKEYLLFKDAHNGWLTAYVNSGVPDVYCTTDGGLSWRRQAVGLPPGVHLPTAKSTVFASGTLLQPRFFGRIGLLPEEVGFYRPKLRTSWSRLYVLRSKDGGRTWSSTVRTPVTGHVTVWQAIDARHWFFTVTGPAPQEAIWWTDNGGTSWTRYSLHVPAGLTIVGVAMLSRTQGWATAQTHADSDVSASGTVLLHTMDGGVQWTEGRLP